MKFAILVVACLAGLGPMLAAADFTDNQIEEGLPFRYTRPQGRARHVVKSCKPCGPSECQVMGMQRFSEPRCEALGGLGAPCRMWQEPENKTLSFPGVLLECPDVYMQFCPCARGLVCTEAECRRPRAQGRPSVSTPPLSQRPRPRPRAELELERESFGELEQPELEGAYEVGEADQLEEEIPIAFEPARESRFPWAVARFH